ncbi:hypothetical protein FHQ18_02725 [Deferribacter autotrophicus]|uniref:Uncharacterized protein n=1 Tax=Deferribacter autotrophicus TaxID=500465 RepID=A0A5A8F4J4_9BACT|nr:hypothetical protein [Deferribacter autotrophicus]KAA0258877.1 hypothetical protein FHQ18_02725 [Deferribacter autotrophicus]
MEKSSPKSKFIIQAFVLLGILSLYTILCANLSIGQAEEKAILKDKEVCENSFKMDLLDEINKLEKKLKSDGKITQSEFVLLKMKLEECYKEEF